MFQMQWPLTFILSLSPLPGSFFLGTQAKGAVDGADATRLSRNVNRTLQIPGNEAGRQERREGDKNREA